MIYNPTEKLVTDYGKLLLLREVGQSIVIQQKIKIVPFNISLNKVKFGIKCPEHIQIRLEIGDNSETFFASRNYKNEFIIINVAQGDTLHIGNEIKMQIHPLQERGGVPLSFVAPKNVEISRYELTGEGNRRNAERKNGQKNRRRFNPNEESFS